MFDEKVYKEMYDILSKTSTNHTVIPNNCLSFYEQSLYIAEAAQRSYNDLFQNIGFCELAIFEATGHMAVYTEAAKLNIKERFLEFVKKMWEAIKGFFEKAVNFFNEQKKNAKEKFAKIMKDNEKIQNLDDNKVYGKSYNFNLYDINDFVKNAKDYTQNVRDKFEAANQATDDYNSKKFKKIRKNTSISADQVTDYINSKKFVEIFGSEYSSVTTVDDLKNKIKEICMGEQIEAKGDYIKKHYKEIKEVVLEGSTIDHIKVLYKDIKDFYATEMSKIKSSNYTDPQYYKAHMEVLKDVSNIITSTSSVYCDIFKTRYSCYRNLFMKVLLSFNGEKESDNNVQNVGESTTTYDGFIKEAFNW